MTEDDPGSLRWCKEREGDDESEDIVSFLYPTSNRIAC